jgi:hypothetical protein
MLTFIPALALNIPHGVIFHSPLPALGLIPQAFSAALAVYDLDLLGRFSRRHEYRVVLEDDTNEGIKTPNLRQAIVALVDLLLCVALICCITSGFIMLNEWRYYSGVPSAVLASFATMPYIVNV